MDVRSHLPYDNFCCMDCVVSQVSTIKFKVVGKREDVIYSFTTDLIVLGKMGSYLVEICVLEFFQQLE